MPAAKHPRLATLFAIWASFTGFALWRQCSPPQACQCAEMGHARP